MKIQPTQDRVLIRRAKGQEKTAGGLYIPEASREKMGEGTVVAVGPGRTREKALYLDLGNLSPEDAVRVVLGARELFAGDGATPCAVKVGQRVLFSAYSGTPLEMEEVEETPSTADHEGGGRRERCQYVLMREDEIIALVEGEGNIETAETAPASPLD